MCDIDEKLQELQMTQKELSTYFNELINQLSIVDKEITDIEHYIEFYNFNASQGYKAYKMLQERLVRRRDIKTKIDKCDIVWNSNIKDFGDNRKVTKQINNINNRKYSARVLKELFENN